MRSHVGNTKAGFTDMIDDGLQNSFGAIVEDSGKVVRSTNLESSANAEKIEGCVQLEKDAANAPHGD